MKFVLPIILLSFYTFQTIASPYFSQCGQDKYAHENFFKNKQNGTFVDVGAHDGITFSNTYFFEKKLGWTGICIEPIPSVFNKLKKNRSCLCVQACAAKKEGFVEFMLVESPAWPEMLSGMVHSFDPRHFDHINSAIHTCGGSYKKINLPAINLEKLLEQQSLFHIDYLSIDTEGSELEILKTIDFNKIQISVISVENNYKEQSLRTFLNSKNFKLVETFDGFDEMYIHTNFTPQN